MKPVWIVENFTDGEDLNSLITEIKNQNYPLTLIDRKTHFQYDHINFDNQCIVFVGSIQMSKIINDRLKPRGCSPILWCDSEKFETKNYWTNFKELLFNDKYEEMTVKQLKDNKWDVYKKFGKEAMIFIRPSSGDKLFKGQLLDIQDFDIFWTNAIVCTATDNDIVVVSTPKNIIGEWRFVVTKYKEILGMSCYQYQGKRTEVPSAPAGAIDKVKEVLDKNMHPASVYALDIAQDSDGNYWLMEFNSFNNSGLYMCDKKAIVKRVSEIAIEEFNI